MRLIDADALLEKAGASGLIIAGMRSGKSYLSLYCHILRAAVDSAPTVDAVPVVRCRDCKYSDTECHKDGFRYCMRGIAADDYSETGYIYPIEVVVRDDDFCSYGELKELEEGDE